MTDHSTLAAALAADELADMTPLDRSIFFDRIDLHGPEITRTLHGLYGDTHDVTELSERFIRMAAGRYAQRSLELRTLDLRRQAEPDWFQSERMIGYAGYVDRIAENLEDIARRLPLLQELGVTYLHLLPLLQAREGESDGGYAVADYGAVDVRFGTMDDLERLTAALRQAGISLCIDIVCNHTADSHEWAQRAKEGDRTYQDYYLMFEDRTEPDRFEETLREIFPVAAPGNFTWIDEIERWVWTTFRRYQWDLNYGNPAVLGEMADVMLNLANVGAEVFRLDAVAFMWKRMGTMSENLPEAHLILQFFRAITRLACPGVILKAEAIVPIDDTLPYLGVGEATGKECELAYHHFLMVLAWSALAEQNSRLFRAALGRVPATMPSLNAWCTYVRSHDDIGWAITPQDAATAGVNDFDHRNFLTDFYTGAFPLSFAAGHIFEENHRTKDRRVSGSTASLAGLETAMASDDPVAVEYAYRRIRLLYAIAAAAGGIPIVWSGDELATTNDYTYTEDPHRATDNRWLHRASLEEDAIERRKDPTTAEGRVFGDLSGLLAARAASPELHAAASSSPVDTGNDAVVGIRRSGARGTLLVLANTTPHPQIVTPIALSGYGVTGPLRDRLTNTKIAANSAVHLEPYDVQWVVTDRG